MRITARITFALLLATAGIAPAAASGHDACDAVAGIGFACRVDGLFRVVLADGSVVWTHGADPVPSEPQAGTFTDPRPPACVADRSRELHGMALYVHASDTANRADTMRATVVDLVERANGMLHGEAVSAGRTLDLRMACDAQGTVRVDAVTLTTQLASTTFTTVLNDLRAAGYADALAKYWIYFDGRPPNAPGGTATLAPGDALSSTNPNNWGPSYGVDWGFTGSGGAKVLLHEAAHTLGAVQSSAPNSSGAGHCNDGRDVMCYADGGWRSTYDGSVCSVTRFDCNRDDYFDPAPAPGSYLATRWNLGSPFNRAVQGCSIATGRLTSGDPISSSMSVTVPPACEGRWYAGMAFLPGAPAGPDPSFTGWHNSSAILPDVDVCWYAGATLLSCETAGRDASGSVQAGATRAVIELRSGAAAAVVLSVV